MRLKETQKLLETWRHAISCGTNIILMRHAPKIGSNNSALTPTGKKIAENYGKILSIFRPSLEDSQFCHTSRIRTSDTLHRVFPHIYHATVPIDLDVDRTSPAMQEVVNNLHRHFGHPRGYCLNQTYYFLERLGGECDEYSENLHVGVPARMIRAIEELTKNGQRLIYCGHSPAIEVTCERLLGLSLAEMGGFLKPMDSLHIKRIGSTYHLVARINPILDYVDIEAESYYSR